MIVIYIYISYETDINMGGAIMELVAWVNDIYNTAK